MARHRSSNAVPRTPLAGRIELIYPGPGTPRRPTRSHLAGRRVSTGYAPWREGFAGALQGAQASRGIFIATTRFSSGARDFAEKVPSRIILIDGRRLGELMVTYDCGVQEAETVVIKKIDEDFFADG